MGETRPPRPAVPRPPAPRPASRPAVPRPPAARRPVATVEVDQPHGQELVGAESEALAAPWRRLAPRARPERSGEPPAPAPASDTRPAWRRAAGAALHPRRACAAREPVAAGIGNVTTRLQARLKEKARAQRRLSMVVWARRAGYLAAVALVGWVVLASPVFALDPAKVEVTGYGTVVAPADVTATVAEFEDQSLATLSTSRLADALREIPGVRDAAIDRVWPAGLVIELTSREPVAAVPSPEGGFSFVDAEATPVGRADQAPAHLPVVTVPVGEDHARVLASALGVINQLPAELRDRLQDVSASTEDTVTFVLRDGPRIEWGSAQDTPLKAEVLQVLLASGRSEGASVIDVSAPTLPITRS